MEREAKIKSLREIAERKARWRAEDKKANASLSLAHLAGDDIVKAPLDIAAMKIPLNEDG